jgi:hypothetical protein
MAETELDYDVDIEIDKYQLDAEWVLQPQLFLKYMHAASDARMQMDRAKESVDLVRAKMDKQIRREHGEKKPTESAIVSLILESREYQGAMEEYLEAKNRWEVMKAAADAFDQRRAALENLVKLYGMGYFSAPRENGDSQDGLRQMTREAIRERMARDR